MNYLNALYRKNNYGQPCFWEINKVNARTYKIEYGIIGKSIITEFGNVNNKVDEAIQSKINAKRKTGYKYLCEVKDDATLPVKGELINFLTAYLPDYRTTADGELLAMLAKTYDNKNNKLFKSVSTYIGQWKINGLRCTVSAYEDSGNMFKPIGLKFLSREGTYWNSLSNLEDYLLATLPNKLLNLMIEEHYILDGEIYLPGYSINEINHFVKDPKCKENKLLQYWVYDLAIEDIPQYKRNEILYNYIPNVKTINTLDVHLSNKDRLLLLPNVNINSHELAISYRDNFIDIGFEGLILRNPNGTYQFGKRNQTMMKFKKSTDGKFTIIDIIPEGIKRPDMPLFVCKNDINDTLFECRVGGTVEYQKQCLKDKDNIIGKQMYVEFGERSGVNQVPFHIKTTYIIDGDN